MTTAERLRAEGEARGEARGRAEALIELLTVKFGTLPPNTVQTIRNSDPEQVRLWTARVLDATTLDQIIA